MNGLREIWNECKLGQSPVHHSEDETNSSLADSPAPLVCESETLTQSQGRRIMRKSAARLSATIPAEEVAAAARDEVVGKVVNIQEGYIHVLRLAELVKCAICENMA